MAKTYKLADDLNVLGDTILTSLADVSGQILSVDNIGKIYGKSFIDSIDYININEHLKIGAFNVANTLEDGMMFYENDNFIFRENGETKSFGDIIDNHVMKALEKNLKIDSNDVTISYLGEADPGSSLSGSNWRIRKIVEDGENISVEWADGNGNFDNIFDDRESLNYS